MDSQAHFPRPKLVREPPRKLYSQHWAHLKSNRDPYYQTWVELGDFVLPFVGLRYEDETTYSKNTQQSRRRPVIINNKATMAARILINGLASGLTSQSRPWLKLKTPKGTAEPDWEAKKWLEGATKSILWLAGTSNYYSGIKMQYRDMVVFGPGVKILDQHPELNLNAINAPVGSYCLTLGENQRPDGLIREVIYTVGQMVEKFGYRQCSVQVKEAYDRGDYYKEYKVCHVIEPNRLYQGPNKIGPAGMKYASVYYEAQCPQNEEQLLSYKGYMDRPFSAGRWDYLPGDTYGSSAALETLGDIKALQVLEFRKAQAVDKQVTPPTQSPPSLSGQRINHLPGANTAVPDVNGKITSLYDVRPDMISISNEIGRHEGRIDVAFFVDVIQSVTNLTRQNVKAEEIVERREEKLLAIAPVLEAVFTDVLDVDVMRMLSIGLQIGLIPPPPASIRQGAFTIKYTSTLAQAMEAIQVGTIERLFTFGGGLLGVYPEAKDVLDADAAIYEYAEAIGAPTSVLVPEAAVDELRKMRQEQAQQQQAMAQTKEMTDAAKNMSETKMTDPSMLNYLIGGLQ